MKAWILVLAVWGRKKSYQICYIFLLPHKFYFLKEFELFIFFSNKPCSQHESMHHFSSSNEESCGCNMQAWGVASEYMSFFCFWSLSLIIIEGGTECLSFRTNTRKLTLPTSFVLKFSACLCGEAWEQYSEQKRGQARILQRVPLYPCSLGELPWAVL